MKLGIRFGRIILAIIRPIVYILFPYRFVHRERIPQGNGPMIVCCNHISMVDPAFLLLAFKRPIYFMGKEELFHNRLFGYIIEHWFGVFPVARGKGDSSAIEKAFSVLENDGNLGIFPEGTRSKDGALGKAKSGTALIAAKMNAPVYPCALFTKSGRVKAFRKTTVVFGDVLTLEELHLDGEKPDLRYASRKIMETIAQMIEENRA